jgi:hypothetical protein
MDRHYLHIAKFEKNVWSIAEEHVFMSAIQGLRKVEIEVKAPYDPQTGDLQRQLDDKINELDFDHNKFDIKVSVKFNLEDACEKVMKELKDVFHLKEIQSTKQSLRCGGYFYKVIAHFPELILLEQHNKYHVMYMESLARISLRRLMLNDPLEIICCQMIDQLFMKATLAYNKGERYVLLDEPHADFERPFHPQFLKMLTHEFKTNFPFLGFQVVEVSYGLYELMHLLVWNFDENNKRLFQKDVPQYLCNAFPEGFDYLDA